MGLFNMFLLNFKPGIHGRLGEKPSTGHGASHGFSTSMMLFYWKVNILKKCILECSIPAQ